jgi:hypothetical protein
MQYMINQQKLLFVVGVAFAVAIGRLTVDELAEPKMGLLGAEARVVKGWLVQREC